MNSYNQPTDWADLRIFLAIVDGGNLGAAAELLEISQPTAGRRLAAMEARLGVSLFARTGRRMLLTDAGQAIVESARVMEREMHAIYRSVDGQSRGLAGEVTVSATEGTGSQWLIPVLASLQETYPDISVKLQIESRAVNLMEREADIALRIGRPSQLDLVCRKLATIGFGIYASAERLERFGPVASAADLNGAAWVRGAFSPGDSGILTDFLTGHDLDYTFAVTTNSPTAQINAVAAGLGFGVLSHRWAAMFPELAPVLSGEQVASIELWLVTHVDLRHSARIRAVSDHIVAYAELDRVAFEVGTPVG